MRNIKDIFKSNKKVYYKFYDITHIFNSKSKYVFKNNTIYEIKEKIYKLTKNQIEGKYGKDYFLKLKTKKRKYGYRDIFDFYDVKILGNSVPDNSKNNSDYIYNYGEIIISDERFLFSKRRKGILLKYEIKKLFQSKEDFLSIFDDDKDKNKFLNTGIIGGKAQGKIVEKIKGIDIEKILDKFYYCDIYLSINTLKNILNSTEDKLVFIIEDENEKEFIDILKGDRNKDFILKSLNLKNGQEFYGSDIVRGWGNVNFNFVNKNKILNFGMSHNSGQMVAPKWYRKVENKIIKNNLKQDMFRKIKEGDYENISTGKYVKNGSWYY